MLRALIVHGRDGVTQFNDPDLADRHAKLNSPSAVYHRSQVSRIVGDDLLLHVGHSEPMRRF